jgi:hypothetical protein
MTALRAEIERFIGSDPAAPVEAIETLIVWLERDDDELAIAFSDELRALCARTDLQPAQARQRLVEMLKHFTRMLEQVIPKRN